MVTVSWVKEEAVKLREVRKGEGWEEKRERRRGGSGWWERMDARRVMRDVEDMIGGVWIWDDA